MEYDPPKLVGRSTKIINEIDLIPVNSAGVAPTATAPENRTGLSTDNVAQGEPEVNTVAEGIRPSKTGRSFNSSPLHIKHIIFDSVRSHLLARRSRQNGILLLLLKVTQKHFRRSIKSAVAACGAPLCVIHLRG